MNDGKVRPCHTKSKKVGCGSDLKLKKLEEPSHEQCP